MNASIRCGMGSAAVREIRVSHWAQELLLQETAAHTRWICIDAGACASMQAHAASGGPPSQSFQLFTEERPMLRYAAIFFIIAIIAAVFGFGGIAAGAAEIAKVLFFIFIVIFLVTLLMGVVRR
jgi:uncharacterized membrane protein YtjA (UPF0391 family)